jgi:hypothetical protein
MDKGYDSNRVHAECAERDVLPVIPIKGEKASQVVMPIIEGTTRFNPRIQRHTEQYRELYRNRVAGEREFGRLKHDGLAPLRVRAWSVFSFTPTSRFSRGSRLPYIAPKL